MAKTLENYSRVQFDEIGRIGNVKVVCADQPNKATPMEAFTSKMYYVANPETGRIESISFYDKKGNIMHSIDLQFNSDGSPKSYREYKRKGKLHSEGCHFHRVWKIQENGDKGRRRHASHNVEAVNRYYMRFVNRAVKYNQKIKK